MAPEGHVAATKLWHECNYLQANEGNIDLSHLSFLHYNYLNRGVGAGIGADIGSKDTGGVEVDPEGILSKRGAAPEAETADAELTEFGVRSYKIRRDMGPGKYHLYITDYVIPNLTAFPGSSRGKGGYMVNWHVPVDDTHHWKYTFTFSRETTIDRDRLSPRWERTSDYRSIHNKPDRYGQDRASMKTKSYCGVGLDSDTQDGALQDQFATEGQGPIQDRTKEHLLSMDKAIIVARKVLLKAIRDLQQGLEAPNVIRDPRSNRFGIVAFKGVIPDSKGWKEYARELEAEGRV
jgi:hypothetical protein